MRTFASIYLVLLSILLSGDIFLGLVPSSSSLLANAAIIPRDYMNLRRSQLSRENSRHSDDSPIPVEAREEGEDIRARASHVRNTPDAGTRSGEGTGIRGREMLAEREREERGPYVVYKRVHPRDFRTRRFVMEE